MCHFDIQPNCVLVLYLNINITSFALWLAPLEFGTSPAQGTVTCMYSTLPVNNHPALMYSNDQDWMCWV